MKNIILGGGYAGLNTYYNLKCNKLLISNTDKFIFYTAFLRNIIHKTNYTTNIEFVKQEQIKDIDIQNKIVRTDKNEYYADNLIIALGCKRQNLNKIIDFIIKNNNIIIGVEDQYDEYIALQIAFYAKRVGKNVKYVGSPLSWLGKNVEEKVSSLLSKYKIEIYEKPNLILQKCEPPESLDFLKVNSNLEVKNGVYAVGDIIHGWPKLGELAMRSGRFLGKKISKKDSSPFQPIFIFILDTGYGEALHVRSKVPWGSTWNIAKISRIRSLMKRFIERYYIIRKGNMGFLYYL
jgi:NADH dehydrogenase FAD-containing subunit